MFNKFQWRQKVYKDDLLAVIANGLIFGVLGGILGGLLDYITMYFGISICFGLMILSYFVGKKVRQSYYSYHILYPTLTIIFMLIGLMFSEITYLICTLRSFEYFLLLIKPISLFKILISPIINVITSLQAFNFLDLFISLFNLVMYGIAFTYAYRVAKGRN